MTSGGLGSDIDAALLGVEIGRNRVRLSLLDRSGSRLLDAVERPIAKAGGPRDPIEQEFSTREAIQAGLERIGPELPALSVGATIGFPNCGVGSGPALHDWLRSLSEELAEPVVSTVGSGVSYAPSSCVEFVRQVFSPIGLPLHRVELAPVSAARVIASMRSGAISLGSGVAWSARLLNGQVLEAFESADGSFDDELRVVVNGVGQPVRRLDGFEIEPSFGRDRGLSAGSLAPSVGVALALLEPGGANLLQGDAAVGADTSTADETAVRAGVPVNGATAEAEAWGQADSDQGVLPQPPPVDVHLPPGSDPVGFDMGEPGVDDLGSIQDELRAHQSDETYRLRRMPRNIERSRELRGTAPPPPHSRGGQLDEVPPNQFDRIEDFAHPGAGPSGGGFRISDFILGALLMLAIVLALALVVL